MRDLPKKDRTDGPAPKATISKPHKMIRNIFSLDRSHTLIWDISLTPLFDYTGVRGGCRGKSYYIVVFNTLQGTDGLAGAAGHVGTSGSKEALTCRKRGVSVMAMAKENPETG